MYVNVIITPKKNEVVECNSVYTEDGCLVCVEDIVTKVGRKNVNTTRIKCSFKKWIRFYVLPDAETGKQQELEKAMNKPVKPIKKRDSKS